MSNADLSLHAVEGIRERIGIQDERKKGRAVSASSRRRKGPAFLPSEHDDLPSGVAFMVRRSYSDKIAGANGVLVQTLSGHLAPITSLDFSEPYGVAVTASLDESVRLWDLTTGDPLGYLKGHTGASYPPPVAGPIANATHRRRQSPPSRIFRLRYRRRRWPNPHLGPRPRRIDLPSSTRLSSSRRHRAIDGERLVRQVGGRLWWGSGAR